MTDPLGPDDSLQVPRQSHAKGFEQRLLRRLRAVALPGGSTVALGFSGGIDSLCLATALARVSGPGKVQVHLVHIDHGIRAESGNDAERARRLADELGLPITIWRLATGLSARSGGLGLEEAGRRERYLALREVCDDIGSEVTALAHHQGDQAESVLLHLLRGAGLKGAAGMAELSDLVVPWWSDTDRAPLKLWRPLLSEARAELEAYVRVAVLAPIEDPSNADRQFFRNWLRHDLLPKLDDRQPGSTSGLARYAAIASTEDDYIDAVAASALVRATNDHGVLVWSTLTEEHLAIRRRVVWRWLTGALPFQEISLERVEAVMDFAAQSHLDGLLEIGGGAIVVRDRDGLLTGSRESVMARLRTQFQGPLASDGFTAVQLQSGGAVEIDGWRICVLGGEAIHIRKVGAGDLLSVSKEPVREWRRRSGLHPLLRDRLLVVESANDGVWAVARERESERRTAPQKAFVLSKLEESG